MRGDLHGPLRIARGHGALVVAGGCGRQPASAHAKNASAVKPDRECRAKPGRSECRGPRWCLRASCARCLGRGCRQGCRGCVFNRFNPPIATRWNRLEIAGRAGLVAEHAPQLGHDAGQGVIGDGRVGPERFEDLLLGEKVAGALHHQHQQVERLGLERERRRRRVRAGSCPGRERSRPIDNGWPLSAEYAGELGKVTRNGVITKTSEPVPGFQGSTVPGSSNFGTMELWNPGTVPIFIPGSAAARGRQTSRAQRDAAATGRRLRPAADRCVRSSRPARRA